MSAIPWLAPSLLGSAGLTVKLTERGWAWEYSGFKPGMGVSPWERFYHAPCAHTPFKTSQYAGWSSYADERIIGEPKQKGERKSILFRSPF